MLKKQDVPYYRRREGQELDRAAHAHSDPARKAHLNLAEMYHRALDRYSAVRRARAPEGKVDGPA
jgi:hypothetical protein